MTDDDHDEERDPLLVRPYLRKGTEAGTEAGTDTGAGTGAGTGTGRADTGTATTWPSATTRETRSQSALEGADAPTEILTLPPPRPAGSRRRLLVLASVCALVLLGAAAAAFATLSPTGRPPTSAAPLDAPLLIPTGPLPATSRANHPPATKTAKATRSTSTAKATKPSSASTTPPPSPAKPANTPADGGGKVTTAPPNLVAPDPPSARTGTIRGQNGLCLDVNGGVAADLNHVQVFTCNTTAAQVWTLATDGTLRVLGMCALIAGDNTVHITDCDTRSAAQWRADGQALINAANDQCLTDPSGGATSGTGVTVTPCANRAGQHWSFP